MFNIFCAQLLKAFKKPVFEAGLRGSTYSVLWLCTGAHSAQITPQPFLVAVLWHLLLVIQYSLYTQKVWSECSSQLSPSIRFGAGIFWCFCLKFPPAPLHHSVGHSLLDVWAPQASAGGAQLTGGCCLNHSSNSLQKHNTFSLSDKHLFPHLWWSKGRR